MPLRLAPFLHLLGEWAARAIGIVLETEVFEDLQQALLMSDGFEENFPARIVTK